VVAERSKEALTPGRLALPGAEALNRRAAQESESENENLRSENLRILSLSRPAIEGLSAAAACRSGEPFAAPFRPLDIDLL
jgi:hypothetical protein